MTCTPSEIYSVMVCSFGLRLLQNGFVALHRYRFQLDLPVKEGEESSMDGFIQHKAPTERRGSRTRKEKHIAVDDDASYREGFTEDILGEYLNCGVPIDLDELLGSDVPASEDGSSKGQEFTKASRMVNGVSFEHTFIFMAFFLTLRLFAGPSHDEPSP